MDSERIDETKGEPPAEWPQNFQGEAVLQVLPTPFTADPMVFAVHFRPGGRTRPHVHGAGQMLVVTSGRGVVANESSRRLVEAGDVVAVMPGEWHWHGATPDSAMTHVTVQLAEGGTDWDVDERDWAGDCPG
jgi:quercetin dioxygenase-like cupin family protein